MGLLATGRCRAVDGRIVLRTEVAAARCRALGAGSIGRVHDGCRGTASFAGILHLQARLRIFPAYSWPERPAIINASVMAVMVARQMHN